MSDAPCSRCDSALSKMQVARALSFLLGATLLGFWACDHRGPSRGADDPFDDGEQTCGPCDDGYEPCIGDGPCCCPKLCSSYAGAACLACCQHDLVSLGPDDCAELFCGVTLPNNCAPGPLCPECCAGTYSGAHKDYIGVLLNACVCTTGAPCEPGCHEAMGVDSTCVLTDECMSCGFAQQALDAPCVLAAKESCAGSTCASYVTCIAGCETGGGGAGGEAGSGGGGMGGAGGATGLGGEGGSGGR